MKIKSIMNGLVWLIYPLVILFGLQVMEPRYVALILIVSLVLRRSHQVRRLMADMSWLDLSIFVLLSGFAVMTAAINSETLLRFYPLAVNLGMLLLFGLSLLRPPSMIERFARLHRPDLPSDGVRYTRKVTGIWCAFFVINGGIAAWTAIDSSREVWALYNGFIAYLLMGLLFAGEWLYRRHHNYT